METFSVLLALCAGNSPATGALMFSFICARINSWVKNHEAGDLRRHRAYYDVIVMERQISKLYANNNLLQLSDFLSVIGTNYLV